MEWVHEIKWGGYRVSAYLEAGKATIYTRNGHDWTHRFPAIAASVSALHLHSAVIDGEAVVLDDQGRSSFTAEAKALGIRMGDPWFKIRDLCRREGVRVFSSNYALYGDMSARSNTIYRGFSPRVEVYSIDESFLDLSDVAAGRRVELCRDLRSTVLAWTGIPTCVGIGPTKTLAKLANHLAKKNPELRGVCDLTDEAERDRWLARTSLDEIWGVGPATHFRSGLSNFARLAANNACSYGFCIIGKLL